MPSLKEALELWKIIDQRLTSSELQTCKSLLEELKSHRIGRNQVHTSLGRLFKKDDYLHQRFAQLFPYSDYDKDGHTQEDTDTEEGEIREEETEKEKKRSRETTPSLKEARELWKIMDERLSSSEVKTCKSLLEDLICHRRERNQVYTSLGRLLKKDECLHQRFTRLCPYSVYDREEGEIREEGRHLRDDHPKIDHQAVAIANDEIRVTHVSTVSEAAQNHKCILKNVDTIGDKILTGQEDTDMEQGEIREEDQHLRDDPKIDHHEIRVTYVSPSYRLFMLPEEEEKSRVSEKALNNKCILMQVDTCGGKILTGREKIMAKCEDEMFHADLWIETLRSAIWSVEKVMSGEMRIENLGASFYTCVKELLCIRRDTVNENALPGILIRLKEKLGKLTVARESKKSGWKKVLQRQRKN